MGRLGTIAIVVMMSGCVLSANRDDDGPTPGADAAQADSAIVPNEIDAEPESADAGPLDADLSCFGETAIPLTLGVLATGNNLGGANNLGSCGGGGPEVYYRLELDDAVLPANVTFQMDDNSTNFDSVLTILQGCGAASTELACNDDGGGNDVETLSLSIPGVYYVAIDSHTGSGGDYGIIVTAVPVP